MPLLLYACRDCGAEQEFLLAQGESPKEGCACGGRRWARRMPRRVGISFKGGGFYASDARTNGASKAKAKPKADGPTKKDKATSPKKGGGDD